MVAWQASAFAAVALLVGLPLGSLAGRWAWALFASVAGVSAAATVPLATVLLAIPATLPPANLIAAAPGWEAARLRPALRPANGVSHGNGLAGAARRPQATWRALLSLALLLGPHRRRGADRRRGRPAHRHRLSAAAELGQRHPGPRSSRRPTDYPADYYAALPNCRRSPPAFHRGAVPGGAADGPARVPTTRCTPSRSPDRRRGRLRRPGQDPAGSAVRSRQRRPGRDRPAARRPGAPAAPAARCACSAMPNHPRPAVPDLAKRVPLSFRVTAVVVFDNQVVPTDRQRAATRADRRCSARFTRDPARFTVRSSYADAADVRLRPGATSAAFIARRAARWRNGTRTPGERASSSSTSPTRWPPPSRRSARRRSRSRRSPRWPG